MRSLKLRFRLALMAVLIAAAHASQCPADTITSVTYAGSESTVYQQQQENLAASATFVFDADTHQLTVTLTNTSGFVTPDLAGTLTGLYFDTTHLLSPVSAAIAPGSSAVNGTITNVGDGWAYGTGLGTSAQGMNSEITATGAVNNGNAPSQPNFSATPTQNLDGGAYGIVSNGTVAFLDGLKNNGPQVEDSIVFTLTAASGFSLTELGGAVVFQFGTALSEPNFTGPPGNITTFQSTPEPKEIVAGLGALGAVLPILTLRRRRTQFV